MDATARRALKKDFLSWSGGFPPDSNEEITVYIDYALHRGVNEDEVREYLLRWMNNARPNEYESA